MKVKFGGISEIVFYEPGPVNMRIIILVVCWNLLNP